MTNVEEAGRSCSRLDLEKCKQMVLADRKEYTDTHSGEKMDPQEALGLLQQPTELYILNISQPILNPTASAKRSSNASDQERTPSALRADLEHYRELFSKLRFSYVEQVTKERFLRAVTAEQPEFVDGDENRELGEKLAADKAALKARKEEVRGIIGDLEEQGKVLAKRKYIVRFATTPGRADSLSQDTKMSNSKQHSSQRCRRRLRILRRLSRLFAHRNSQNLQTRRSTYHYNLRSRCFLRRNRNLRILIARLRTSGVCCQRRSALWQTWRRIWDRWRLARMERYRARMRRRKERRMVGWEMSWRREAAGLRAWMAD